MVESAPVGGGALGYNPRGEGAPAERNLLMAYDSFQDFLHRLEREGELRHIQEPVSPYLEITEVADRMMKSPGGGKALVFDNPTSFNMPLAINTLGSKRRMELALGVSDVEEIAAEIADLIKPEPPTGLMDKLRMIPKLGRIASVPPKTVNSGLCQEVVRTGEDVDLTALPVLHCWPQDGGPFITLPLVFTYDPVTGKRNCGMYRMQVYDRNTTGMHWQLHKVGAEHHRKSEEKDQRIQAAVALGGDPACTFSAIAPLPPGIDEMLFAGFLRHKPVNLVQCKTVDIKVPADAEIVLEGYVDPHERRTEGPFGDHTGFYTLTEEYPVFHVTAMTHRRKPVYPATIVGRPPMEDGYMGKAVERIFLPLIQMMVPEIVDMNLPVEACFHNMCFVSIRKRYPGHAFKVMNALWGLGQLMFTKMIFVFDDDVNVQDISECIWRLSNNIDPERDMLLTRGPIDVLDHASRETGFGSKIGFDCTKKIAAEGFHRRWPDAIEMSPEVKAKVDALWPKLGL
jgi:4-hydroxy-3-polyprenylbenzoate decarboxylase